MTPCSRDSSKPVRKAVSSVVSRSSAKARRRTEKLPSQPARCLTAILPPRVVLASTAATTSAGCSSKSSETAPSVVSANTLTLLVPPAAPDEPAPCRRASWKEGGSVLPAERTEGEGEPTTVSGRRLFDDGERSRILLSILKCVVLSTSSPPTAKEPVMGAFRVVTRTPEGEWQAHSTLPCAVSMVIPATDELMEGGARAVKSPERVELVVERCKVVRAAKEPLMGKLVVVTEMAPTVDVY